MADEKWLFWVCKECPLADDCKPESFKRAKCWAETKEEAMAALVRHLVHSSHHNIPADDAEQIASEATFDHEDWTSAKPAPVRLVSPKRRLASAEKKADEVQPSKPRAHRSRSPPVEAAASKASGSAPTPAAKVVNTRINVEGPGPVFVEVLEHCAALMKDFKKPPKPPQQQLELAATSRASHSGDILMVPAEKVKHAIDSLGRGITAATHAQRLALAAANSFSVEVEVLTDVKKTLEAIMTTGD